MTYTPSPITDRDKLNDIVLASLAYADSQAYYDNAERLRQRGLYAYISWTAIPRTVWDLAMMHGGLEAVHTEALERGIRLEDLLQIPANVTWPGVIY